MLALVLDDAELNNLVMVSSLRAIDGCVPRDFTVPAEALAFAQARAAEIGVVITDYEMPGMNGVEFIRTVRRVPGLAHVPVVMVTSFDQRSLRREALEAGANDFLAKPADPIEIRARVTNPLALLAALRAQRDHAAQLTRDVAAAVALVEEREREIVLTLMRATPWSIASCGTSSWTSDPRSTSPRSGTSSAGTWRAGTGSGSRTPYAPGRGSMDGVDPDVRQAVPSRACSRSASAGALTKEASTRPA